MTHPSIKRIATALTRMAKEAGVSSELQQLMDNLDGHVHTELLEEDETSHGFSAAKDVDLVIVRTLAEAIVN